MDITDHCAAAAKLAWSGVQTENFHEDKNKQIPRMIFGKLRRQRFLLKYKCWLYILYLTRLFLHCKKRCWTYEEKFYPLDLLYCERHSQRMCQFSEKSNGQLLTSCMKLSKPYSQIIEYVHDPSQLSTIQAVFLRLRETKRKIRHLHFENGAVFPYN